MKIAIYHPNLDLFGGGESVALQIARALSEKNDIDIYTPYLVSKKRLEDYFSLDLSSINIKRFGRIINILPLPNSIKPGLLLSIVYPQLEKYDLVIDTCTNGMFDRQLKTRTACYIHFPNFQKKKFGLKSIFNPFIIRPEKAFKYDLILCNSKFTKDAVSRMTDKPLIVLYPPVNVEKIIPDRHKQDRIITIGRISPEKKHEILIDAFKKLDIKGYEFHLIGAFQENSEFYREDYLKMLMQKAQGYPVFFHLNMPHEKVLSFVEESKIYWHARGYRENDPTEYENFGITTVEAMAGGCIPIVIKLGAQPEIIQHGVNGYCWETIDELLSLTRKIIKKKDNRIIIKNMVQSSKFYKLSRFYNELNKMLGNGK